MPNIRNKKKPAPDIKPRPEGRPRLFRTPEELDNAITLYISACETKGDWANKEGFCLWYGCYNDLFAEYAKFKEFSATLARISLYSKNSLLNKGLKNEYNSAIVKLIASANFGMSEKTEVDQSNTNLNIAANKNNIQDLKALIRKARESKDNV